MIFFPDPTFICNPTFIGEKRVFKISFGKIQKILNSETTTQNPLLEVTLLSKVDFSRDHLYNKFSISTQSEHFDFSLISDIWPSFHEKSKSLDRANIEKLLNQSPPWG